MSTLFADNFNRANGTLNTGNWTGSGAAAELRIVSNTVQAAADGNARRLSRVTTAAQTFPADQWAEIIITARSSSALYGPAVRCGAGGGDPERGYVGRHDAGVWKIVVYTGSGAYEAATQSFGSEPSVPYTMRVEAVGNTITLLVNGAPVVSATDTALASGQPGLFGYTQGGFTFDDFAAGDLAPDAGALLPPVFFSANF